MTHRAVLAITLFLVGCGTKESAERYPLRDDLLKYHFAVTSSSPEAQKYFDQGFVLYYGFNHEAAIASFRQAVALDSGFAMAWWGQAISAGPNINNPFMDSAAAHDAWIAVRRAEELATHVSPLEADLIQSLGARYAWPAPEDRKALDLAYADSMRAVWKRHSGQSDVGALLADALLNLRPWDLWREDGSPQPETPEIVETLESVLRREPDHPGACHFYIHTVEASPHPERAAGAAEVLRDRIPGAGHLVHMPSHIDIRTGKYDAAVKANLRGVSVDSTWASQGGFYTLYRAHNYHFLAYAAMFDGRRELSLRAAREMVAQIPLELVREYPDFLDGFNAVPIHVMVRFGMWKELLAEPEPPADLIATRAFWHYGRTVAFAALGQVKNARTELRLLTQAYDAVPDSRLIGNNPAKTVLAVGLPMAEGELEYRRGKYPRAFALLRESVRRDDALRYDEPWGWMMPVRHSLGALLLEQGRLREAEEVYREDLRIHPGNGWALKGLAECLHRTGRHHEAEETDAMFRTTWARSDIVIRSSCFCRTEFTM